MNFAFAIDDDQLEGTDKGPTNALCPVDALTALTVCL